MKNDLLSNFSLVKISQLHIFSLIAENKNFQQTGQILGLSQPAISAAIKQLESTMQTKLFNRTTKKVELTPIGKELLPHVQEMLNLYQKTIDVMSQSNRTAGNIIHLSVSPMFMQTQMPKLLAKITNHLPKAHLHITEHTTKDIYQMLNDSDCDIGVCEVLNDLQSLQCTPLYQDELGLVIHNSNLSNRVETLDSWHTIVKSPRYIRSPLDNILSQNGLSIANNKLHVDTIHCLLPLINQRVGISAIPSTLFKQGDYPELTFIPIKQPVISQQIGLVTTQPTQSTKTTPSNPSKPFLNEIIQMITEYSLSSNLLFLSK